MKQRSAFAAVFFAWTLCAAAQVPPLHVMASNGVRAALEALKAECGRAAGKPLTIDYGSTATLRKKIEAGEAFDLAILTPEATADLAKNGKIASGTAMELARTGVGFGIRAGSPKVDISTPAAVKQTLLSAKSISIVKDGASRATVEKMFDRLGVAQAIASKVKLEAGTEAAGEAVRQGHSELEIIPLSEIPLVPGVQTLGPLPGELQNYLRFHASVGVNANDPGAARKTIAFLASPAAAAAFKASGMETK